MDNKQTNELSAPERWFFLIVRAVLGVILFPIVWLLAAVGLLLILPAIATREPDEDMIVLVTIVSALIGLAASVVFVWKVPLVFRKLHVLSRLGVREPIVSCLEYGFAGAILFGGGLLAIILFLGHTRPGRWDLDQIPLLSGIGFVALSLVGLQIGLEKKRRQKP